MFLSSYQEEKGCSVSLLWHPKGALGTYLLSYALCSQKLTLPTASVAQRSQDNAARHPCCPPKKRPLGIPTVTSVLSREPEPSVPDAHTCLLAE